MFLNMCRLSYQLIFKKDAIANTKSLYKSDQTVNEQQYNSKQQQHNVGNIDTEEILQWKDTDHTYYMRESIMKIYWK